MSKNKYMGMAKDTVKLGVGSMAGSMAIGSISSLPGMPQAGKDAGNIALAGIGLANIGNLANVGMNIMPSGKSKKSKKMNIKW